MVAVDLAGIGLQRHAEFLGLGFAPSFILTKKGLVSGLGDQAGAVVVFM
jgi:hypothetical protein